MWLKFKWDMFVTSFIPLWLSILIFDIWDIITVSIDAWKKNEETVRNLTDCVINSKVQLLSIAIIVLTVSVSVHGINRFLKERECSNQNSPGTFLKARKANKLSSEFLLAYILPLFPDNKALTKALYLATDEITKKWTNTLRDWGRVYAELSVMYPGRFS